MSVSAIYKTLQKHRECSLLADDIDGRREGWEAKQHEADTKGTFYKRRGGQNCQSIPKEWEMAIFGQRFL